MGQETEIKLRIEDLSALQRALKKIKATLVKGKERVHEYNVLFDTPEGRLAKHEQMLRIRTETPEAKRAKDKKATKREVTLTFKGPSDGSGAGQGGGNHKVREELETEVDDAEGLTKIFEALGMRIFFRYEKYRTTFRLPEGQRWAKELKIELDETPMGMFVELEGPSEAIDRAAEGLGFSKQDYITENYLVLYREECKRQGEEPGDMVFGKEKGASLRRSASAAR